MEKNLDQRATIQFCVKLGYNVTKMYENIQKHSMSRLCLVRQHFDGTDYSQAATSL